jgi:hypothetical protein
MNCSSPGWQPTWRKISKEPINKFFKKEEKKLQLLTLTRKELYTNTAPRLLSCKKLRDKPRYNWAYNQKGKAIRAVSELRLWSHGYKRISTDFVSSIRKTTVMDKIESKCAYSRKMIREGKVWPDCCDVVLVRIIIIQYRVEYSHQCVFIL